MKVVMLWPRSVVILSLVLLLICSTSLITTISNWGWGETFRILTSRKVSEGEAMAGAGGMILCVFLIFAILGLVLGICAIHNEKNKRKEA